MSTVPPPLPCESEGSAALTESEIAAAHHAHYLSAREIIASRDILALFAKEISQTLAGEKLNAKLLYLIGTSRLFPRTMHAAIKGTSSGGKSELRKRLLAFFPPEEVISFTSMTEKTLIYFDGSFEHKILSMGEAAATEDQNFQDYLLRELISEGSIVHKVPMKVGKDIITQTIEKTGPVAFLVTTTRNALHPENETRLISLEIDDSEAQTRSVMEKVAQVEGLSLASTSIDYTPWHAFQRWLRDRERRVIVPFASDLVNFIPAKSVRLRRDLGQVLRAIKAHALLHRGELFGINLNALLRSLVEKDKYQRVAGLGHCIAALTRYLSSHAARILCNHLAEAITLDGNLLSDFDLVVELDQMLNEPARGGQYRERAITDKDGHVLARASHWPGNDAVMLEDVHRPFHE